VPNRPGLNPNYQSTDMNGMTPAGYGADPRLSPRPPVRPATPPPRAPLPTEEEAYDDHEFYADQAPPRGGRRSAADYQQAYRDMEHGYEEEAPRSRGPWILLALLLLAVAVAGAGVWFYQSSIKPSMTSQTTTEQVPVVAAPAGADKTQPEPPAATAEQAPVGKKRIYDRIVGDQEVLGGAMAPTEEVPLAPAEGNSQIPDPAAAPDGGQGLGDDAAPLPIPPPPGDGNTQGALPQDPSKQSASLSDSAAGASQAAVVASEPAPAPPAPGEIVEPAAAAAEQESIADAPPASPPKKLVEQKPAKKPAKKDATAKLGSKPVVLVPAKKKPSAPTATTTDDDVTASLDSPAADTSGLYGAAEETVATAPPAAAPQPVKKKKTLTDLFNNSSDDAAPAVAAEEPAPQPAKPAAVTKPKVAAPAPAETQVASASGYAAQLASFRTRQEATAEYARLKAKHGPILQGLAPVVSEAQVLGSTRYRLAVGGLASRDQAAAICARLLAAGERDCIVKRQ
jgi:hypothetical protein